MGGLIASIAEGVVSGALKIFPQMTQLIGGFIIQAKQNKAAQEGQQDADGAKLAADWLLAIQQANNGKMEHQTERIALRAFIAFAAPVGVVWWAGLMDGIPWDLPWMAAAHKVGSWKIAVPPGFDEDFHSIIRSFFYTTPAVASVAVLAKMFRRS